MSHTASSSKTAAIAGAIAGLLAAGLGGYLYHEAHRPATPPPASATPQHATAAPAGSGSATPPAQEQGGRSGATPAATPGASPAGGTATSPATPLTSTSTSTSTSSAAAASAASALAAPRSKAQATQDLMALPELKAWSSRIEQRSGGKAHGALIEYDPEPRVVKGKRYWQLTFVENSDQAAQPWESFLVALRGDEILVEDLATDSLLSLERWRKEKQPMRRGGGD